MRASVAEVSLYGSKKINFLLLCFVFVFLF